MIKAIIFDFDGVILESADIKTEAFADLFSDYPDKVKDILDYHLANAGISRYVKFRYIYENFLGKDFSKQEEKQLGEEFSQIVLNKVLSACFVPGAKEFLEEGRSKYKFFIASGTPEKELHNILQDRGLNIYFEKVYGSPKEKSSIIKEIIKNYGFSKREVVFVGDAESDRIAAKEADIVFVERKKSFDPKVKNSKNVVGDLVGFREFLDKINNCLTKEQLR